MNSSNTTQLTAIKGIGPKRAEQILAVLTRRDQKLDDLFQMSAADIKQHFKLPITAAQAIVDYAAAARPVVPGAANSTKPAKIKTASSGLTGQIIQVGPADRDYPARLLHILNEKAPERLHLWGNLDLLTRPAVGFCGSRNVSEKGLQVTADAVEQLADLGWVVVSGHARGVDTTAHRTALEHGGATIIVAPEGLEQFRLRQELRQYASPDRILIMSEFAPPTRWSVGNAMTRNQTIIALSNAMILIESRLEGGTFDAGKKALKLKIPLFVASYQTTTESNEGNQYFLDRGAIALKKSRETERANLTSLREIVERSSGSQPVPGQAIEAEQLRLFGA